jgi:putative transposase
MYLVMSMKKLSGGTVYDLSIHLVLVTKYRRKVISSDVLARLEQIFRATALKWDCAVTEFNGEADHVHMLLEINPKAQISKLANNLKTVSSRLIQKEFEQHVKLFLKNDAFWKIGYCVSSTGGASIETIKKYIQSQSEIN